LQIATNLDACWFKNHRQPFEKLSSRTNVFKKYIPHKFEAFDVSVCECAWWDF